MKGKRIAAIITALALCLCFVPGCGRTQELSSQQSEDQTLRVYTTKRVNQELYVIFRQQYPDVTLELEQFETAVEMDERLIQDLNTNTGPDVVLFNSFTTLDLYKLAFSQAFLPLDDVLITDENYNPDNYLAAAIQGCKLDGVQYFMPLTVQPLAAFYIQSLQDRLAIAQGQTSLADVFSHYTSYQDTYGQEKLYFDWWRGSLGDMKAFSYGQFIAATGMTFFNEDRTEFVADEEDFRQLVDWLKLLHRQEQIAREETTIYDDEWLFLTSFDMLPGMFIDSLNQIKETHQTESYGYVLPTAKDPAAYAATIAWFGAVTKDAKNPEMAREFLKGAIESYRQIGVNRIGYTPVLKKEFYKMVESMKITSIYVYSRVDPLTDEQAGQISTVYENITTCTLPDPKLEGFILTEFQSYFDDEDSYDSCYESFLRKISLYLNE